jgi:hypothetical protein
VSLGVFEKDDITPMYSDIHRYIPMYIGCGRSEGEYVSLGVLEKDDKHRCTAIYTDVYRVRSE